MQVCVSPLHPCYNNSLTHSSLKPFGESHSLLNITLGSQKMTLSKEELKKAAQSHTVDEDYVQGRGGCLDNRATALQYGGLRSSPEVT